ncbi:MAG: hypothetical protein IPN26_02005 [Bacteroidetes bacterium]|nr:hypothetical protein [Bacteroidota bacterium]
MQQKFLLLFLLVIGAHSMDAQIWTGSASNVWTNPLNWTPNSVPGPGSVVIINASTNNPKLQANTTVAAFLSGSGDTLDVNGFTLTVTGTTSNYNVFNNITWINTNAATDIVLNIATPTGGYFTQINGNVFNDHVTINLTGSDNFSEGTTANTYNGNCTYNINSGLNATFSASTASQFNGNLNVNRTVAGSTSLFSTGGNVTGNFNYQNTVGGATSLGFSSANTSIGGTITLQATYPTPNSFTMFRMKNATTGGTINIQNSIAPNIQNDTLKVTTFTMQGYEGNAYAYFLSNKLDGNIIIEDDIAYSTGYETYFRLNTITGNTTVTIKGSSPFYEAQSAGQANTFNGNTVINMQGVAPLYLSHGSKSTYNGNLTVNRTVAGYTRVFLAGATINGNFTYNNTASGDNDLGNITNLTSISGTVNMNVNLSPIGRFEMYRLINQTPGGKINVHNSRGFDVQSDSLKVDSLNIVSYRGSAYGYFLNNQLTGHLTIADSTSYTSGYDTRIRNSTITGNTNFKSYTTTSVNAFYEAYQLANTYNGNLTIDIFGNGNFYTSYQGKSTITGNYTVNRSAAGYTSLFGNAANITGNFSFTKNAAGGSDLGTLGSKTSVGGTFSINITQTTADVFSLSRIQNLTNGGSVSITNTQAPNIQQDSLLVTSFTVNGYGGSNYLYLYNNQLTGNLTLTDAAGYTGGYNTQMRNNTITGNTVVNSNGTNHVYEAITQANLYNGNLTFNIAGSGNVYTSYQGKSIINGNYTVNRTAAGYTSLFGNAATISGNFSYTKNAGGGSDLGTLSSKTSIGGTINLNVTQNLTSPFSLSRIQNLTNGGSPSILNIQAPDIQQDSLLVTSFSLTGYANQFAYFYNNQLTGNLTWSDSASYTGGFNTQFRNSTINGNSTITILGTNTFLESNSALPNTFNGNVTYNCNGSGSLYTSVNSKTIYTGNLTVNRTIGGYTSLFGNGATIGGNFSYTKNNAGGSDLGTLATKTSIAGTINMNVTQNLSSAFSMSRIQNLTNGGSISVSTTLAPDIQQDSLLVTSFSFLGYANQFAYFHNNQITGNFSWADDVTYTGGYITSFRNNTINGTSNIIINGSNIFNDGTAVNSGSTYLGNVTYTRLNGAMNIGTADTNSYAGNFVLNNSAALPINTELIKFIGSTNTNIDQLGTGAIDIQKMILNKSAAARVTLNKPVRITTSCAFLTGYINSTTSNPLIFPDNINHNSASDNSHVIGCVTKAGNDIFTFPLGNGIGYHPLAITAPALATDSFQACIILKHPSDDGYNVTSKDAALLQIAPYHYWTLNQIAGINSETVSLGWSIPCANSVIGSLPGMAVARWNGTQWNNLGYTGTSGTAALGTVTQSGTTTSYGVFALATTSAANSWQITTVSASASTVCAGTSTTLTASGAATYNWQPGNLSGTSVVLTPATTTTYTITGTSATGCITTATKTITVNPVPVVNAGADKINTCTTPSNSIGTAAIGGTTYNWLPATGLSASNIAQPIANPAATTTYTVTATTTATGCTASDAVLVTVNKTPPTANAGVDKTNTCTTPSNTIGTASVVGNTYSWAPATGLSSSTMAQPVANPAATTNYTVTVTNTANGCTATDVVIVTVNKTPPTANAGADKTNTCSTPSNTIGTAAVAGRSYAWLPASGLSATNVAQPTANPASTTNYTVTVTTTANGCTASDVVIVNVNKTAPTVNTSATSTSICTGSSTTITATGASSYTWQPGSLSGASITVSPASTTTYTVTGTNATNGCTATSTRTITVSLCATNLTVKAFMEGYYAGAGSMQPVLINQGQTPSVPNQCDNISIELHNPTPPYALASTTIRPILMNGTLTATYLNILGQSYYIVLKHRNGVELWSANPIVMTPSLTYDFTTAAAQAFGSNQVSVGPGIWAMYCGDINQDDVIDGLDYNEWETDNNIFASGYYSTDLNGDGVVDGLDFLYWEQNNNNFIGAVTP